MGNLLSLVAELEEEGEKLRNVGDSEKEMSGRTALYHSLDKHICHPHHKKQWILYPLITRQKEWTSEMRGIEMRNSGKNIFTLLMSKVVSFYRGQLPNIIEMPGSLSQS
ncbi:hypothetical protein TURU_020155 [Turdus rufiventris]|nr:hypothetical protein TURU_020155 [Turdus rufiventris]